MSELSTDNILTFEVFHTTRKPEYDWLKPGWYWHAGNDCAGGEGYWCGDHAGPFPTAELAVKDMANEYAVFGHEWPDGLKKFGPYNDGNS